MIQNIRNVYNMLEDDISKHVFMARINMGITGDKDYIRKLSPKYRNLSSDIECFADELHKKVGERNVIFGAGSSGGIVAEGFGKTIPFFGFIDNYKNGIVDAKTGLPIYSLEDYKKRFGIGNTKFIIAINAREETASVYKQLIDAGVEKCNIIEIPFDWRNNTSQYFDFFTPRLNEVFVDCGCYDGSTALRFAGWCGRCGYDKIISFEPDPVSFSHCKRVLSVLKNCEVYPYGISDKESDVAFIANGNEDARVVRGGELFSDMEKIHTIVLDDFLKNEKVTFIKMDIEGAEYDALKGASEIIIKQKPRLAISIYHNEDHIITIPKLLKELHPDYKLSIRHYSLVENETILYAE